MNGADFKSETLSPGAWISILGQNLGQVETASSSNTLTVGGASVTVCGTAAILNYNSGPVTANGSTGWQINALVPDGVGGQTSCPVVATVGAQSSPPVNIAIASGIMELFQFTTSAGTLPIITHADYSLVGPASAGLVPATPNETVIAWATGDCSTPSATVGAVSATIAFSGRVGLGLCQINFVIPSTASGSSQLRISSSPNTYLDLAVRYDVIPACGGNPSPPTQTSPIPPAAIGARISYGPSLVPTESGISAI